MKHLKILLTISTIFMLLACGGGNKTTSTTTPDSTTPVSLYTSAPSAVTLSSAATTSYTIGGGVPPYAAGSSNASVATVSVSGATLSISGGTAGNATALVLDSAGAKVELALTVGSSTPSTALRTTAPSAITLGVGVANTFTISGGTAPYAASSSNTGVVTVGVSGTTILSVIGGASSGTAQILVIDATGTQVVIGVTVGSASVPTLYTSAPSAITMSSGAAATNFTIGGGVPPYAASSSNTGVATASVTGTSLSVSSGVVGSATVLVLDSVGAKVELALTVGDSTPSVPLYTSAPSAITLAPGSLNNFTVAGGTAPYAASSSNTGVATVGLTGSALTITGSATGAAQVLVFDSVGTQVLVGVTVGSPTPTALYTTAPSAITIASGGAAATYTVAGGTLPYSATSSNTAVLTVSVTGGTLSLTGLTAGNASVNVFDATGTNLSIAATVSAVAGTALNVLPSGATGNVGDTLTFTLLGGAPGYSLSVSNSNIATVSTASVATSGGTFTASLLNVGSTVVTVFDAQGQTTSFVLSVGSVATQLRLSPSAFIVGENETAAITLNIFGGTPPYRALTSDLVKAVVPAGNLPSSTLATSVGSSGNRCINPVTDAVPPVYIPSGTYDVTLTVIDSLGASATSIMTIKDNGAGLGLGCP